MGRKCNLKIVTQIRLDYRELIVGKVLDKKINKMVDLQADWTQGHLEIDKINNLQLKLQDRKQELHWILLKILAKQELNRTQIILIIITVITYTPPIPKHLILDQIILALLNQI